VAVFFSWVDVKYRFPIFYNVVYPFSLEQTRCKWNY